MRIVTWLALAACAGSSDVSPDPGAAGAHEREPRDHCEHRTGAFADAAGARYPGSENYLLWPSTANFTGSTDGDLVVDGPRRGQIDGKLVLQSRLCGPTSTWDDCNVVTFAGTLFGYEVDPLTAGHAVRDDFWCYDDDAPVWFAGFVDLAFPEKTLFLQAEEADVAEDEGDPVLNPDAVVYGVDVQIWDVPADCTLEAMPCVQDRPLATGTLTRGDRPRWK